MCVLQVKQLASSSDSHEHVAEASGKLLVKRLAGGERFINAITLAAAVNHYVVEQFLRSKKVRPWRRRAAYCRQRMGAGPDSCCCRSSGQWPAVSNTWPLS